MRLRARLLALRHILQGHRGFSAAAAAAESVKVCGFQQAHAFTKPGRCMCVPAGAAVKLLPNSSWGTATLALSPLREMMCGAPRGMHSKPSRLFGLPLQVPITVFGPAGKYASAVYVAAVKNKALEVVESELTQLADVSGRSFHHNEDQERYGHDIGFTTSCSLHLDCAGQRLKLRRVACICGAVFVQVTSTNQNFNMFLRDPSVPKDVRIKGIEDILGEAKFSPITKNLLGEHKETGWGACELCERPAGGIGALLGLVLQ